MSTSYLTEVSTDAARGETARIFDEIRRLTAGPLVALIYRHLASHPGALEALWQGIGPLLAGGELQEQAWGCARDAWVGPVPSLVGAMPAIDTREMARAIDVIDAYNRANPVNYMIVCVVRAAQSAGAGGPVPRRSVAVWTPPPRSGAIAPIPAMAELPSAVRALVDSFAKAAAPGAPMLVPTLYRHLAHWPALLEVVAREVQPRLAQAVFAPAIRAFQTAIAAAATALVARHGLGADPLLATPAMNEVFGRFGEVIPEMVVVGSFLRRLLREG